MFIIRLVMVHMGPKHTQYGQKTARLAPVLQNGLKGHVRPPSAADSPCFRIRMALCIVRLMRPGTPPLNGARELKHQNHLVLKKQPAMPQARRAL